MKSGKHPGREKYNRLIAPWTKRATNERGFIVRVVKEMNKLTKGKKRWHRQEVDRWLHPDESKRTEPSFGTGLLLTYALMRAYSHRPAVHPPRLPQ